MSSHSSKPFSHGIFLVVGGAIGAGMFALPPVSACAWFWWSALGMLIVSIMTNLATITVAKTHWQLLSNKHQDTSLAPSLMRQIQTYKHV